MDEDNSSGWQLTESDPGVFSQLLKTLTVRRQSSQAETIPLQVDDLYSLDPDSLRELQPIHALIFLFKWVAPSGNDPASSTTGGTYDDAFPGFFAHQVVNNACATLAVLNAIGNIPDVTTGSQLSELFSFTRGLDPQTCGMAVTSVDWLREAHNALSPPSAISLDGLDLPKTSEDAYHFIVYLPFMDTVYELDGLKRAPINHGAYTEGGEGWVAKAREVIQARISTYPPGSLEFNLLAIRDDPLPGLQARLTALQSSGVESEAAEIVVRIANENTKRERWAFENSLRRHNHLGLIHALLDALAKSGQLGAATAGARQKMSERIARRAEKGVGMDED
ncbi:ubiquitin-specific protease [Punctularia strigosozonata HHB-11173 SS5]|uniref:ubiquitin-specific protease n=1 Tax=Punctularia strigosozonata (strain HHB-11173) TaxID=741275 RepID=UPI000441873F|nr:ubiquitin-specific protease [Punctularia strigosozonata HHB-11173 SS5]EIN12094.1 ubiquitin-specific protease [Punctularia strigosozonata HHB-11173 SS5]